MTDLIVTPYAPYRDGIAAYAVQEAKQLRVEGRDVEVLSPLPSAAPHHMPLGRVRDIAPFIKFASSYSRVVLQFYPQLFFGGTRTTAERSAIWFALSKLADRTDLEFRIHEIMYNDLERHGGERRAAAVALSKASRITVHSTPEADELANAVGRHDLQIELIDHGRYFTPNANDTVADARHELGLAAGKHIFLAIGFIQEHKGFDRAVDAFAKGAPDNAELHIVGSVRVDHPHLLEYQSNLAQLCGRTPQVTFHNRFVSDLAFDQWIIAADTIVLPYREIWSSGVLERANLFGRTVIASHVGGLESQIAEGSHLFHDEEDLARIIKLRAAEGTASAEGQTPMNSEISGLGIEDEQQIVVSGRDAGWDLDNQSVTRAQVERQIRLRAQAANRSSTRSPVEQLLSRDAFVRPAPVGGRKGVPVLKQLVRKAIGWELDPLVARINQLEQDLTMALTELENDSASDERPM